MLARLQPAVMATFSAEMRLPSSSSSSGTAYSWPRCCATAVRSDESPASGPYPVVAGSRVASASFSSISGGGGAPGTPCERLMSAPSSESDRVGR